MISKSRLGLLAFWCSALSFPLAAFCAFAQDKPEAPEPQAPRAPAGFENSSPTEPVQLSLAAALALARQNSTVYQAALAEAGAAHEQRTQARDALLPQVAYNNQYLYTQA